MEMLPGPLIQLILLQYYSIQYLISHTLHKWHLYFKQLKPTQQWNGYLFMCKSYTNPYALKVSWKPVARPYKGLGGPVPFRLAALTCNQMEMGVNKKIHNISYVTTSWHANTPHKNGRLEVKQKKKCLDMQKMRIVKCKVVHSHWTVLITGASYVIEVYPFWSFRPHPWWKPPTHPQHPHASYNTILGPIVGERTTCWNRF